MVRLSEEMEALPAALTGARVVQALTTCQAARLRDLAIATGLSIAAVLDALRSLAAEGRVDVLEPLRGRSRTEVPAATDGFWDGVFFRLRRPRDAQFRWQREIEVRLPVGRLYDVWQGETVGAREHRTSVRAMGPRATGRKDSL